MTARHACGVDGGERATTAGVPCWRLCLLGVTLLVVNDAHCW